MAKYILKESELRRYIRSMINEMGCPKKDYYKEIYPNEKEQIDRMRQGLDYYRDKFNSDAAKHLEKEYHKSQGHKWPLYKKKAPANGIEPTHIGRNGEDLTPENKPEALEAEARRRRAKYTRNNRANKKQAQAAINNGMTSNDKTADFTQKLKNVTPEKRDGHQTNDQWLTTKDFNTQFYLLLTPEERDEYNDMLRRENMEKKKVEYNDQEAKSKELDDMHRRMAILRRQEIRQKKADAERQKEIIIQRDGGENANNVAELSKLNKIIRDCERLLHAPKPKVKKDVADKESEVTPEDYETLSSNDRGETMPTGDQYYNNVDYLDDIANSLMY